MSSRENYFDNLPKGESSPYFPTDLLTTYSNFDDYRRAEEALDQAVELDGWVAKGYESASMINHMHTVYPGVQIRGIRQERGRYQWITKGDFPSVTY